MPLIYWILQYYSQKKKRKKEEEFYDINQSMVNWDFVDAISI